MVGPLRQTLATPSSQRCRMTCLMEAGVDGRVCGAGSGIKALLDASFGPAIELETTEIVTSTDATLVRYNGPREQAPGTLTPLLALPARDLQARRGDR